MKNILVINPKGGCGKTTIATNLASYYALWEVPVGIIDYDPQESALDWISQRPGDLNPIEGINGARGRIRLNRELQRVIMDAPARTSKPQLKKLIDLADVVIAPVLPSPIDMRAAAHFIEEMDSENLLKKTKLGLVGNRVRESTLIFNNLRKFLRKQDVPLISSFRDTQNYIRAAQGGFGIFEMPPYLVEKDIEHWRPVINWIEAK